MYGFPEGVLRVISFMVSCLKWLMKKLGVAKILQAVRHSYMIIFVTMIHKNLDINLLLFPFFLLWNQEARIQFSVNCWSGIEKYFCFLLITSCALLQPNSIDFYKGICVKCFYCSYYSFIITKCEKPLLLLFYLARFSTVKLFWKNLEKYQESYYLSQADLTITFSK